MITQLDMFGGATQPSTSVVGLVATLPTVCACGATEATIGSSAGPHFASLICSTCGKHRGWVSATTFHFITDVIDSFGRPHQPIEIRFKNSRVSADTPL